MTLALEDKEWKYSALPVFEVECGHWVPRNVADQYLRHLT